MISRIQYWYWDAGGRSGMCIRQEIGVGIDDRIGDASGCGQRQRGQGDHGEDLWRIGRGKSYGESSRGELAGKVVRAGLREE